MKRDSTAYAAARPEWDRSDCSVRALAVATGATYEQASAVFSAAGRSVKRGTSQETSQKLYESWLKMERIREPEGWTLDMFLLMFPKGSYVLHRRGHAFAVIDGVLHDWELGTKERSRITHCWCVTKEAREKMARMAGLVG